MGETILRSHCPINYGLELFGDKWTLLILRDIIFRGKRHYSDFLESEEGFATNILVTRLKNLEDAKILEKKRDPQDARKSNYVMTEKGLDLIPMLFEMILWSSRYDKNSEAKRITKLVEMIRKDNRTISRKVIGHVKAGKPMFPEYLD